MSIQNKFKISFLQVINSNIVGFMIRTLKIIIIISLIKLKMQKYNTNIYIITELIYIFH